jgi:hypothetical protein
MQHEFEEVKSHQFEDGERYKLIKQHTYTLPKKSSTCILTTSKPTQRPLLYMHKMQGGDRSTVEPYVRRGYI